jgi:hypothetical protein
VSGCSEYWKIKTGRLGIAFDGSVVTAGLKIEQVKSRGAVSPAARAIASAREAYHGLALTVQNNELEKYEPVFKRIISSVHQRK